jgi:hypothetical protein
MSAAIFPGTVARPAAPRKLPKELAVLRHRLFEETHHKLKRGADAGAPARVSQVKVNGADVKSKLRGHGRLLLAGDDQINHLSLSGSELHA